MVNNALDKLNDEEKKIALQILNEMTSEGISETYQNLLYEDYKEIPVDIETFLTDDRYLGKAWKDSQGNIKLYEFWLERLKELFPDNLSTSVNNFIESGARGIGKAQPLYSQILTSRGFVNMGDIKVGDMVYGDDGKTHSVIAIFPQGKKKVYEVEFNDRSKTRCSDEHLWNVHKQGTHQGFKTLTLNDIISNGIIKCDSRGFNVSNYSIPMTQPIEFPHMDTFIDPYTLGCLIGDGGLSGNSIKFTSKDDEIIQKINKNIKSNGYELSKIVDKFGYSLRRIKHKNIPNEYQQEIITLNLNCTSENKFIPALYKFNDINTRLEILQGLMDTDGYCAKKGYCTLTTVSKQLATDVVFLVQSLGGTAPVRIRTNRTYKDRNGNKILCKDAYEITVNLPNDLKPFTLRRKVDRLKKTKHRPVRVIKKVTYIGEEECQCILLNSESHLYLTDDLIVTHNSEVAVGAAAAYLMYRVMCLKNPLEYFGLKPTEKVCFAFMNIKLALAEEIAVDKFQKTIQLSPWFMSKGTMTKRNNSPYWVPPDPISVIIGSDSTAVIGQPIYFCLDGNTKIYTDNGICRIEDLVDKTIRVPSITECGNIQLSEVCTVKPTAACTDEYEIVLEDDTVIKCTPNHRFMLKDGSYKEAQYLTEDDELFDVEDIKKFGYIYKYTMIPTNKIYIGKREKSRFDESYYGSGKAWKQDLAKYGKELVKREILCWGSSREDLNKKEIYWIAKLKANDPSIGYNIHKGGAGGNSLGDTKAWSELHKGSKNGRYGKPVSQETRDKIGAANSGKIRSQETKDKISKSTKGIPKPDGFGNKISKALKGRKNTWQRKAVLCIETSIVYESPIDAEQKLDICRQNIQKACKTNCTAGGYHWRYINED